MIRRRIVLAGTLVALFAAGWWVGRGRASGDVYSNFDLFIEVMHAVQTSYVDPVEPHKLVNGGIQGMLRELDPWSQYMDEREFASFSASMSTGFDGIGAWVDRREGVPVVIAPQEGSPAWEAGLLPGDAIIKVDGHATFGLAIPDVGDLLRGTPGTKVTLTVARPSESSERDVVLTRRHIDTRPVPYAFVTPGGTGYVRLSGFSEHAGDAVRAALDTLRASGARAVVLDLRGNPGGLVDEAVAVVQQLVPEGSLVVYTKGRASASGRRYLAARARPELAWPVAVLVDGGSASASEIVAGALQDLDRAVVVGQTSFGKGSVQNVYPLREHAGALKLTTALYYTPSGRSINRPHSAEDALEDDDEDTNPDTTRADSAARPAFHTRAGRTVYGGGGITPDVEVRPDSLPPLARAAENGRLAFRFAGHWTASHGAHAAADDAAFDAFVAELKSGGLDTSPAAVAASRGALRRALERELARRASGAAAAAKVALADDPVYQRAAKILSHAHGPRDVFAAAVPPAHRAR